MSDRLFLSFLVKNVIVVFCVIFFWVLNSFGAASRWNDNGSLTIIIGKTDINQNVKVWCSDDLVWINGGDVKKANGDSVKCEEVKTLIIFGSYQANEVDLREMDKGGFRDDIEISVDFS